MANPVILVRCINNLSHRSHIPIPYLHLGEVYEVEETSVNEGLYFMRSGHTERYLSKDHFEVLAEKKRKVAKPQPKPKSAIETLKAMMRH